MIVEKKQNKAKEKHIKKRKKQTKKQKTAVPSILRKPLSKVLFISFLNKEIFQNEEDG